jgi:endonuclease YncB( thermonuclease family)
MMNRTLVSLAVALTVSLSLVSLDARAQSAGGARIGPCRALRVTDADSADLFCAGEVWRVRMRNVAGPRPGQVGYTEAVRALGELLRARDLYVVPEVPGELPLDANGRVLAYLGDRGGANLNVAFVLLGWASYSTEPGAGRTERRALWTVWSVSADR